MKSLQGKRALVTGGASGIGKAIAERLAAAGTELVLVDLNADALRAAADEFDKRGIRVRTYVLDVTETSRIMGLKEEIARDAGRIDVLVNNAGIVFGGGFLDVPLEKHLTTYRVNTLGLVAMTHAFLPDLIAGADGHVVNVASASGYIGLPFGATYASSKWAVIGFSESMALELELQGQGHVHVTTVCPSYVSTGLFHGAKAPFMTRLLTADRVAEATLRAVLSNRPTVRIPWLVPVTPILKALLPLRLFYRVAAMLGVNTSMMEWRGHTDPSRR
ncbi:MAG: SDR family NAD(P)-dependent oxidoreductase [Gemmatimonas sp.]